MREPRETGGIAVGAIRLSFLTQNTSSPERQREIIQGEADLIKVDELIFTEELDVSATRVPVWDRPDLKYWLENPLKLDHLIFWKLDRVCRNVLETAWLIGWALEHGVNIICNSPRLDLSSPIGRGIALFIGSIAEMEANNIAERIRDARAYMAKVARWPAAKPAYGYAKAPHGSGKGYKLVPDPETSVVVLKCCAEYLAGDSYETIALRREEEGVLPPARTAEKGKKRVDAVTWHATTIQKMLTNTNLRNVVKVKGEIHRDDLGEPLRYGPPLIEDDAWFLLQKEIKSRGKGGFKRGVTRRDASGYLGIVKHVLCGESMYYGGAKEKRSYRCSRRGCPDHGILEVYIEEYVEEQFLAAVGHLEYTFVEEDPGEDHSAELAEVVASLDRLETDRYERNLFQGEAGDRRFGELYAKLERRRAHLAAKPTRPPGRRLVHTGITFAAHWETASVEVRRAMLKDVGAVVRVGAAIRRGHLDWRSRVSFELAGPEQLHLEGTDDPRADEVYGDPGSVLKSQEEGLDVGETEDQALRVEHEEYAMAFAS
ncbi:recombinase family protein [Actinosynnema sp. NPDC020468]|uniref:recombinase family protein n=1 Tax=Actinosynnema sp. NPDC020468 TaxID=3154488 RepID=UPI003404E612